MAQERGRVTVGVTSDGAGRMADLMRTGWFQEEMHLYLLAISTALSQGSACGVPPVTGVTTKYNVGSLDRKGQLRDLITALGPPGIEDPYEYAEQLADAGLRYLHAKLIDQEQMLYEALKSVTAD